MFASYVFLFRDSVARSVPGAQPFCPAGLRRGARCCWLRPADPRVSPQLQPEQLDCGAAHLQHPLAIVNPVTATPVFTYSGLTAVAVASVNNYTVVFLGTAGGGLLKASGGGHGERGGASPSGSPALLPAVSEHLVSFGSGEVAGCCRKLYGDRCCLVTGGR